VLVLFPIFISSIILLKYFRQHQGDGHNADFVYFLLIFQMRHLKTCIPGPVGGGPEVLGGVRA